MIYYIREQNRTDIVWAVEEAIRKVKDLPTPTKAILAECVEKGVVIFETQTSSSLLTRAITTLFYRILSGPMPAYYDTDIECIRVNLAHPRFGRIRVKWSKVVGAITFWAPNIIVRKDVTSFVSKYSRYTREFFVEFFDQLFQKAPSYAASKVSALRAVVADFPLIVCQKLGRYFGPKYHDLVLDMYIKVLSGKVNYYNAARNTIRGIHKVLLDDLDIALAKMGIPATYQKQITEILKDFTYKVSRASLFGEPVSSIFCDPSAVVEAYKAVGLKSSIKVKSILSDETIKKKTKLKSKSVYKPKPFVEFVVPTVPLSLGCELLCTKPNLVKGEFKNVYGSLIHEGAELLLPPT